MLPKQTEDGELEMEKKNDLQSRTKFKPNTH